MRKRFFFLVAFAMLAASVLASPASAQSDQGNAPPTLSFFSSGAGAQAHWQHDDNDSPDDDNLQDIHIRTTPTGFGNVNVHHVFGIPTQSYPNSSFEFKADQVGASLGYPRLVVRFSDGGRGELRPLMWATDWEEVSDPNWDNNGGTCGFRFQTTWQEVQACHPGTFVTDVFVATDPGRAANLFIDNLNTAGKVFNEAADNGGPSGH